MRAHVAVRWCDGAGPRARACKCTCPAWVCSNPSHPLHFQAPCGINKQWGPLASVTSVEVGASPPNSTAAHPGCRMPIMAIICCTWACMRCCSVNPSASPSPSSPSSTASSSSSSPPAASRKQARVLPQRAARVQWRTNQQAGRCAHGPWQQAKLHGAAARAAPGAHAARGLPTQAPAWPRGTLRCARPAVLPPPPWAHSPPLCLQAAHAPLTMFQAGSSSSHASL